MGSRFKQNPNRLFLIYILLWKILFKMIQIQIQIFKLDLDPGFSDPSLRSSKALQIGKCISLSIHHEISHFGLVVVTFCFKGRKNSHWISLPFLPDCRTESFLAHHHTLDSESEVPFPRQLYHLVSPKLLTFKGSLLHR